MPPPPGGAGTTGTGLGIVTDDGGTVTVTVLVLARVDGVVGGPTGTPGMISVEVTVVEVELEVDVGGGGDSLEQALAPTAAAATTMTTMDFNMIAECPVVRTHKPGPRHKAAPLPAGKGQLLSARCQRRSIMVTLAVPPPSHIVCRP